MDWDYIKPTHSSPTQHLMLVRISSQDVQALETALEPFGRCSSVKTFPGKTHGFVSFNSIEGATSALEYINSNEELVQNLSLGVRPGASYSDVKEPKPAGPSSRPIPAVRTAEEAGVPGLYLYTEFITPELEKELLDAVEAGPWQELARRRVKHYGYTFSYLLRGVDKQEETPPLPQLFLPIITRIQALPGIDQPIDQCTANEYPAGVGLAPHVDTHSSFSDFLVSLSLGGSSVMTFRGDGDQRSIFLPARSLLVMSDESRLAWEHSIPQRKSDPVLVQPPGVGDVVDIERPDRRVSLTFRAVRNGPCACAYPEYCDSQNGGAPPTRLALQQQTTQQPSEEGSDVQTNNNNDVDNLASALEEQHVADVYDAIAPHFSATRFAIWPKVREFIDSIPAGAIVADVGCGNGKYFNVRRDIFVAGSDRSGGLAGVAARRLTASVTTPAARADVLQADGLHLPYRPASCDAALCIAVLHHMSTVERRIRLLREIMNLLRPGGRAIVTVWATEQENMKKVANWPRLDASSDSADYLVPWHLPLHRAEAAAAAKGGGASGKPSAAKPAVDDMKGSLVFSRYYHLFEQAELEGLVAAVDGLKLVDSFYDKDNWCIVIEKRC